MNSMRFARRAWPLLIVALTLWPALMVVLGGRDVDALDFASDYDPASFYSMVGRIGALVVLSLAAVTLLFGPQKSRPGESSRNRALPLLVALTIYLVGYSVVPSLFGAIPDFDPSYLYAYLVLFAAYAARRLPMEKFLSALKASLLCLMLAGFATIVLAPELSVQTDVADLRLPILEYRYWGLGSNPNNIAPLALLLIILSIHSPFKSRTLSLIAYASATLTIILAQSVTIWVASMLVLPAFALYSLTPKPIRKARIHPALAVVALVATCIGLSLLVWEVAHFDFANLSDASIRIEGDSIISRDKDDDVGMFSGRTDIWEIAMGTWSDHPWFGYGPTAWDVAFRSMIGFPTAYHAHNQVMQAVSVGGWVALSALIIYVVTLVSLSFRSTRRSNGLTITLLIILLIRGFTEGPLETTTLLSGEVLYHATIVYLLANYLSAKRVASKRTRRSRTRRKRMPSRTAVTA